MLADNWSSIPRRGLRPRRSNALPPGPRPDDCLRELWSRPAEPHRLTRRVRLAGELAGVKTRRGRSLAVQFGGLLALAVAAFCAPLLARAIPGHLVPPVVIEVLAGVAIGPQGLGLVRATGGVYILYLLGFGFLLFLAGQEVDVGQFRGPTFRLTGFSFLVSLAIAFPLGVGLSQVAAGADIRLLALALTASSLGVIVPILRDARRSPFRVRPAHNHGRFSRRVRRADPADCAVFRAARTDVGPGGLCRGHGRRGGRWRGAVATILALALDARGAARHRSVDVTAARAWRIRHSAGFRGGRS